MKNYLQKNIIISGPKRSGTTLINRLFDSHPGVIDLVDEAFFWEHVYDYKKNNLEALFIDIFQRFDSHSLVEGMSDRAILPWLDGIYRQTDGVPYKQVVDTGFKTDVFIKELQGLKDCESISRIWECLVNAYAEASSRDYSDCDTALIKSADYGKSILSAVDSLNNCRCVYIMRNPYYAIDSLKKARELRGAKILHPFNMAEAIRDYCFFWDNREAILSEKTKLIRFEDLLVKPAEIMENVAGHLGIAYTDNLIMPTLANGDWVGLSSFTRTKGIDPSILKRGIKVLSRTEIDFIKTHLKSQLEYFDYIV